MQNFFSLLKANFSQQPGDSSISQDQLQCLALLGGNPHKKVKIEDHSYSSNPTPSTFPADNQQQQLQLLTQLMNAQNHQPSFQNETLMLRQLNQLQQNLVTTGLQQLLGQSSQQKNLFANLQSLFPQQQQLDFILNKSNQISQQSNLLNQLQALQGFNQGSDLQKLLSAHSKQSDTSSLCQNDSIFSLLRQRPENLKSQQPAYGNSSANSSIPGPQNPFSQPQDNNYLSDLARNVQKMKLKGKLAMRRQSQNEMKKIKDEFGQLKHKGNLLQNSDNQETAASNGQYREGNMKKEGEEHASKFQRQPVKNKFKGPKLLKKGVQNYTKEGNCVTVPPSMEKKDYEGFVMDIHRTENEEIKQSRIGKQFQAVIPEAKKQERSQPRKKLEVEWDPNFVEQEKIKLFEEKLNQYMNMEILDQRRILHIFKRFEFNIERTFDNIRKNKKYYLRLLGKSPDTPLKLQKKSEYLKKDGSEASVGKDKEEKIQEEKKEK